MSENDDLRARHAERRRAFLQRSAITAPAVGLLLSQAAFPAKASTYGGTTTTPLVTTLFTTLFSTTYSFTGTLPTTTTGNG